jgi:RNA-directed DNA polymerase
MHGSGLALHLAGPYPSFPIRTVRALAAILQLTERQVRELAEEAGDLYVAGSVLKPDGGWRPIDEPNERLKKVQRALHESLLEPLISSPIGCGVRGRTQIDAARRHAKRPFVGSVDIENFFPSVTSDAVQTLFRQMDCPADLASLLAMLTTLRGSLPQGAPTSPTVAGILLAGVDRQVHEEAQRLGLGVTRYADDFAASGERSESIEALFSVIEEALGPLGLRVNPNKTDIAPRSETQVVLGLTVNNRVSVPKPYRKHLARAVFKASRDGCTERAFRRLRGQIAYVAQLHPKEARGLERALLSARCGR